MCAKYSNGLLEKQKGKNLYFSPDLNRMINHGDWDGQGV